MGRALIYYRQGDYRRAWVNFDQALRLDDTLAGALAGRADSARQLGEAEQAIEDYSQLLDRGKGDSSIFMKRGNLFFRAGNYPQAVADYTNAIRLTPANADAYLDSGLPDATTYHYRVTGINAEGARPATNEAEATTLAAACDRIVPPDDFPGAAEAGAVEFIDRQLATREKEQLETWRRGLRGLDATAHARHRRRFAALDAGEQDGVLRAVEAGEVPAAAWAGVEPRAFFERLLRFTMMGFYGDPRHGGNRGHVSWRMLGVPPAPVRGRLHRDPTDEAG